MALQKQPISLNFAQGLDLKTDDKQVQAGKFLALKNSVFDTAGRLTKRNGFPKITELPNALQTNLITHNDNLIATGSNLYSYSQDTDQWLSKGTVQPIALETTPLVRSTSTQSAVDSAISADGLLCLVYTDTSSGAVVGNYYVISDSSTGQQVVSRVALPATSTNPRVFLLGRYFVITFMATVSAASHLQYIAIPVANPTSPSVATDVDTVVSALTTGYDGEVWNDTLYMAWSGSATTIRLKYMTSTLVISSATTITSHTSTLMSVTVDKTGSGVVWVCYWDSVSTNGFVNAFDTNLTQILAATQIATSFSMVQIAAVAKAGVLTLFFEQNNTYSYPAGPRTDVVYSRTVTQAGSVSSATAILRSAGLASKAFISDSGTVYAMVAFGEGSQPTYFLIDSIGNIYMRLAYGNGGGYISSIVLPKVTLVDSQYEVPYLIKDFLAPVNKGTALPSGSPTSAIYTQVGVNLAKFTINESRQYASEIAGNLHLTGGQLWQYDGVKPVEHGFHVYPDNVASATSAAGGLITANTYYYAFCYEWTDAAGNLHRSAPSIPMKVVTTGSTSTNTLYVPYLRLTYKRTPNPVRLVGYRWSVAQPIYYQFTSLTNPTVNDPASDYATITDALADSAILGNVILYTTGGVLENIAAPACKASALFKNRVFLINAEDPNILEYSKQVIQNVPVEFSDLLTIYVAPTTGSQGSTGPMTAISAMDDKLIIFKKDAIYYLTGTGPDNTGSQNDFSDPVYITASVGCDNPRSIVLTPNGLMFQSDKGIWLLGRDLNTNYIGAAVEPYNDTLVLSAQSIPATNQVRFILGSGITLMYDYFYGQWGTFDNISAISATLFQGYHTYLNSLGSVFQETPGTYLDGTRPVLMSFTTAWITLAGIQGLERFYFAHLLGSYYTPFKLDCRLAYDYNPSATQAIVVTPDNYAAPWGGESNWGSGQAWGGGPGRVFEARLFPEQQKCQSFQLTVNEVFDASLGASAGAGLTLSGLQLTVGAKKGFRTQSAGRSFG